LEKGLELEASKVKILAVSPIAKNLIDLFLSAEEARRGKKKGAGSDPAREAGGPVPCAPSLSRGRIGLLGSGVMGGGIAALLAQSGYRVRMKDINEKALQAGLAKVREIYGGLEKKKRMTRREAANKLAAISVTTGYSGFETALAVIEAVVEDLEVKKKVLREVEEQIPEGVLLASNTSALSISELQLAARRPERVAGLHFFNPVNRMPLVEVVRGKLTSEEAMRQAESLARDLGKIPVRVEDSPGFLVNRLLSPYLNEAARLFEEGFSPESIDRVLKSFGMPMGPFELLDEVGLDVAAKVGERLYQALGERARPPQVLEKLLHEGKLLGKKSGKGFYLHSQERDGKKRLNPALLRFGGGGRSYKPDPEEARRPFGEAGAGAWAKRLVYPIINEAARALEEKIVAGPSLVDLAMVMGTGFAPFRGGPLRYADSLGLTEVAEFLEKTTAPHLRPCEFLLRLAKEGSKFYDLERACVPSAS
jgi:3-hydroxyacyl-CoA dehydrogenase/enoyl-CoA hydratase/3-hydroxybutyryl-CoA epimerase